MTHHSKIYLDTSVINFLYADDVPELKTVTADLFDTYIKTGIYDTCISDFVIQEILKTKDSKHRKKLLKVIEDYNLALLPVDSRLAEIDVLSKIYLGENIIPQKKVFDALHVAVTVVFQIDYLVSWNYRHLANVNKERKIISINLANNYTHNFRILTPLQLITDETE